jgi:uncharacterized surface protein with fasciclin (FAS1) repeats
MRSLAALLVMFAFAVAASPAAAARVTTADVGESNGVIHVIDRVLLPG